MKQILIFITILLSGCSSKTISSATQSSTNGNIPLPHIEKIKYVLSGSKYETLDPERTSILNDFLSIKSAQRQFSDVNDYKVFLVEVDCANQRQVLELCNETIFELSFIIFYNPTSKTANVVNVSYNLLSDSEMYSMTYNLKGKKFSMTEEYFIGGEEINGNQEVESGIGAKYIVIVNKDDQIEIKTIANSKYK